MFKLNDRVSFGVVRPNQTSSAAKTETHFGTVIGVEVIQFRGVTLEVFVIKPEKIGGIWLNIDQVLKFTSSQLELA